MEKKTSKQSEDLASHQEQLLNISEKLERVQLELRALSEDSTRSSSDTSSSTGMLTPTSVGDYQILETPDISANNSRRHCRQ